MVQVVVFIPETRKQQVKDAMFQAGAGKLGNYDCCCFEIHGLGQFRPLAGSRPYLGQTDKIEYVAEVRVEMICSDECLADVLQAMKKSHPYETPAYFATNIVGFKSEFISENH